MSKTGRFEFIWEAAEFEYVWEDADGDHVWRVVITYQIKHQDKHRIVIVEDKRDVLYRIGGVPVYNVVEIDDAKKQELIEYYIEQEGE